MTKINDCQYQIPTHKKGDTWDGLEVLIEEENATNNNELEPINLTGVDILMQFRLQNDSAVVFEFSTLANTIQVPYPLTGIFIIPPVLELTYPPARYIFDIQLKFPTGKVHTIITGSFTIINDISRR